MINRTLSVTTAVSTPLINEYQVSLAVGGLDLLQGQCHAALAPCTPDDVDELPAQALNQTRAHRNMQFAAIVDPVGDGAGDAASVCRDVHEVSL